MMTEEEAKKKWCPYTRFGQTERGVFTNRTDFDPPFYEGHNEKCLGSACMAWRWVNDVNYDGHSKYSATSKSTGYCGLAGRP